MFALLDTRIGVKVLSDLILSYLPLRFIDYTNDDVSRLYQSTRGIGGGPNLIIFHLTVLFHVRLQPPKKSTCSRRAAGGAPRLLSHVVHALLAVVVLNAVFACLWYELDDCRNFLIHKEREIAALFLFLWEMVYLFD